MEEVVYFLGAGFSAPFGIPVMSNFLEKSRDIADNKNLNECKRKRIKHVLDKIDKMYKIAHFYSMDVDNIEDVLSILEMDEHIGIPGFKKIYTDYIKDVIEHYTPKLEAEKFGLDRSDWYSHIFGYVDPHSPSFCQVLKAGLGFFVANIHNLSFQRGQQGSKHIVQRDPNIQTHYSIITLNYDLLLENVCDFINKQYNTDGSVTFATDTYNPEIPILAKLHGSVDTIIIPPTWNKSGIKPRIRDTWKLAYKALVEANYIRIIGYSLPSTDTYVKYLLGSAMMRASYSKKIDVICLDNSEETVKKRYESFINFKHKFVNTKVEYYLSANYRDCCNLGTNGVDSKEIEMKGLEEAHEKFFGRKL